METFETVIIGGGIAGLTAAVYLAKAGISTVVIEKGNQLGGRAQTVKKNEALFNLGGHALYKGGEAEAILNELGIIPSGSVPVTKGSLIWNQSLYTFPSNFTSLLSTKLLSWPGKMELGKLLATLKHINPGALGTLSLREWAEAEIQDPMVRHIFYALCRTSTYCIGPDHQRADAVIQQVIRGLNGVLYVDGGWQTIVEELKESAVNMGVMIITHQSVSSIRKNHSFTVSLSNGESIDALSVLSTASPEQTFRLMEGAESTSLSTWKDRVKPVFAACLDVSLRTLPNPGQQFAIGVDQHILFSNHSRAARLSEDGSAVCQLIKYLGTNPESNAIDCKQELEHILEMLQPGWRKELKSYQYLPHIAVVHDSCAMDHHLSYGPSVPEIPGFYIAGDGAGHGEMLVDAAFASAKRAAQAIVQDAVKRIIQKEA
ncbi:phytoene desaturase family protein [Fictibacillus sp. NRS-1165]|uniref:phytoene desaturase family protein n=1 Tax=Fictibacillus sp. NRS-1165 TaxID=3144463 RepID=UPI003D2062EC